MLIPAEPTRGAPSRLQIKAGAKKNVGAPGWGLLLSALTAPKQDITAAQGNGAVAESEAMHLGQEMPKKSISSRSEAKLGSQPVPQDQAQQLADRSVVTSIKN